MYGFNKVNDMFHASPTTDVQAWEFRHPDFRRGEPWLLPRIRRKGGKPSRGSTDPTAAAAANLPMALAAPSFQNRVSSSGSPFGNALGGDDSANAAAALNAFPAFGDTASSGTSGVLFARQLEDLASQVRYLSDSLAQMRAQVGWSATYTLRALGKVSNVLGELTQQGDGVTGATTENDQDGRSAKRRKGAHCSA